MFVLGILLLTQDESEVQMQVSWEARRWLGVGLGVLTTSPKLQAAEQEKIDHLHQDHCRLDTGKFSLSKRLSSTGTVCPGQLLSPHPWKDFKAMWTWHLWTCFSCGRGGAGTAVGLLDSMGSEVFSNLNDSKILRFYIPHPNPHF